MDATLWMLAGALIALGLVLLHGRLAGFAAQRPEDYAGTGPRLDLREHLRGPMKHHARAFPL